MKERKKMDGEKDDGSDRRAATCLAVAVMRGDRTRLAGRSSRLKPSLRRPPPWLAIFECPSRHHYSSYSPTLFQQSQSLPYYCLL